MKKKLLLIALTVLMLTFWIYQKFYVCDESSRASTDHLVEVCTSATITYWKQYDKLTAERDAVKAKATVARKVRDWRVEEVNEKIKKDIVFRKVEK